jgi:tetratricopeptide (TPR) repeat protein
VSKKIHIGLQYAPDEAIKECRKILDKDAENYYALNHCAVAYMVKGKLDTALHYAALALKIDDTAYVRNLLGQIYLRKGDKKKALIQFRRALKLDPKNTDAQLAVHMLEPKRK